MRSSARALLVGALLALASGLRPGPTTAHFADTLRQQLDGRTLYAGLHNCSKGVIIEQLLSGLVAGRDDDGVLFVYRLSQLGGSACDDVRCAAAALRRHLRSASGLDEALAPLDPERPHACTELVSTKDLLAEADRRRHETEPNVRAVTSAIVDHLARGHCFVRSGGRAEPDNMYVDAIYAKYGNSSDDNDSRAMDEEGLQRLMQDLGLEEVAHYSDPATKAPGVPPESQCLDHHDLLHEYDADASDAVDEGEFLQLCPYLVYRLSMNVQCDTEGAAPHVLDYPAIYGYGTLSVLVVSLMAVVGFFVLPCLTANVYEYVMACFIALAYGTLSGDALLHLIPEALGIEDDGGGGGGRFSVPPHFWKMFTIMMTMYALFLFEASAELFVGGTGRVEDAVEAAGHKGHGHIQQQVTVGRRRSSAHSAIVGPEDEAGGAARGGQASFLGLKTLAWIIVLGDGIHNVADGLAIGASFVNDLQEGLSTSLAVLFHELPHELGDFAILLSTGLSFKQALVWNFVSALTAFIGLYVGIVAGVNESANQWISAIAAAIFLVVALGDMLPEMKNFPSTNKARVFLAQNVGALLGMLCMVLLAVFEGQIHIR